jgi:hypothetical protein
MPFLYQRSFPIGRRNVIGHATVAIGLPRLPPPRGYVMSTVCDCLAPARVSPGDGLRVIACPRLIYLADVLLGRLPVGISGVVSAGRNG